MPTCLCIRGKKIDGMILWMEGQSKMSTEHPVDNRLTIELESADRPQERDGSIAEQLIDRSSPTKQEYRVTREV